VATAGPDIQAVGMACEALIDHANEALLPTFISAVKGSSRPMSRPAAGSAHDVLQVRVLDSVSTAFQANNDNNKAGVFLCVNTSSMCLP
jgi:hypothetical protein